jgi:hypothetical protein
MTPRHFSLSDARGLLPALRGRADRIVALRADLAAAQSLRRRGEDLPGGLAELKSLEAHLQEQIDWFAAEGIQLKGIAPLIVDFPSTVDGEPVLLCWLEGESALAWYHPAETGFMGRRRLPGAHDGGDGR